MNRGHFILLALVLGGGLLLWTTSTHAKTNVADARQVVAQGAMLLDVRTPAEFAAGHVRGAVNIPVDDLERRIGELGAVGSPLVVYCHSGRRSARATRLLKGHGYNEVIDIGAMPNW